MEDRWKKEGRVIVVAEKAIALKKKSSIIKIRYYKTGVVPIMLLCSSYYAKRTRQSAFWKNGG